MAIQVVFRVDGGANRASLGIHVTGFLLSSYTPQAVVAPVGLGALAIDFTGDIVKAIVFVPGHRVADIFVQGAAAAVDGPSRHILAGLAEDAVELVVGIEGGAIIGSRRDSGGNVRQQRPVIDGNTAGPGILCFLNDITGGIPDPDGQIALGIQFAEFLAAAVVIQTGHVAIAVNALDEVAEHIINGTGRDICRGNLVLASAYFRPIDPLGNAVDPRFDLPTHPIVTVVYGTV